MICQFCKHAPKNGFCKVSHTEVSRRWSPCASFEKGDDNEQKTKKATEEVEVSRQSFQNQTRLISLGVCGLDEQTAVREQQEREQARVVHYLQSKLLLQLRLRSEFLQRLLR